MYQAGATQLSSLRKNTMSMDYDARPPVSNSLLPCLCSWLEGDGKEADKRRNTKFKLIPQIVKGSWIVKQSVGTTPVLLGQKLLTRYFR